MHVVTVMITICIVNIGIIMLWCEGYSSSSQMDVTMPVAVAGNTGDNAAVSQLLNLLSLYNSGKYMLHLCYKLSWAVTVLTRFSSTCDTKLFVDVVIHQCDVCTTKKSTI